MGIHTCRPLTETPGHRGPHRLRHFRARVDHDPARAHLAAWISGDTVEAATR
ncbi:hypothetical protein [Streptomyces sp. NPDC088196]|uniref:hypothetical protein n=1 Tax=Streptomyces sp. NPDC088196 TaxID=3154868 RepID=UPI00344BE858